MSDYKAAALMLPVMPKARELLADKATTPIGSSPPSQSAASPRASGRNPIGRSRSPMTLSPTSNATKSKTCSGGSKIGVPSTPDTKSPASCQLTVDSLDMRSNAESFDLGLGKVERRTDPFAAVSRSRRSTIAARRRSAAFPVRSPGSSRHFAVHDVPYRSQDSPAQDTPTEREHRPRSNLTLGARA